MLWENLNTAIQILMNAEDLNQGLSNSFQLLAKSVNANGFTLARVRFTGPDSITINDELTVALGANGWETFSLGIQKQYAYPPDNGPWMAALENGELFGGPITQLSKAWTPLVQQFSLAGFLLFPILVDKAIWGILSMGTTTPDKEWNQEEKGAIRLYCNTLGNLLARRQSEEKIKEQRDFLRQVVDLNPNLIFSKDREGRFTLANKALADLYGTTPKEIFGKRDVDFNRNQDQIDKFLQDDLEVIESLEPKFLVETLTDFRGQDHIFETYKMPLVGTDGQVSRVLGVSTDVTERKIAQKNAEEAQQLREIITSTVPDTLFLIDLNNREIRYSNKSQFIGFTLSELEKPFLLLLDRVHPDDIQKANDGIFLALAQNPDQKTAKAEFRMQHKDGRWVWVEKRATVTKRDPNGNILEYLSIIRDIQEKKMAEQMLDENAAIFKSLYEDNPLGVAFADPKFRVIRSNQVFCQMMGYKETELQQKSILELTHPEDLAFCTETLASAIKNKAPNTQLSKRYIRKDGKIISANIFVSIVYKADSGKLDYLIGMIEDVTEKQRVRKALGESKALQQAILDVLPDIKIRINAEGVIVDYYPSINDSLGHFTTEKELAGRQLSEIVSFPVALGIIKNVNNTLSNREVRYFEFAVPVNGAQQYYEARFSAINTEEAIMVLRNINERIKAQEVLQEKLRELDDKNRQLRAYIDSNMQLENFAYIASHDIREPLRTMRTFAQLLESRYCEKLDDDGRDYVQFIAGAAKNMNQLIEDLLTYSRVESEEYEIDQVDIYQLLEEISQGLGEIIEKTGARVSWRQLPPRIKGNATRLKQLFQNLIVNAVKFGPTDEIPVVTIQCREVDRFWQFSITDNGIGINKEFYEKIFLIFKKLHGKGKYEGTGIGLALCKKIVEQHGGRIWVESILGQGSTFYFTLEK